jgi:ABC-type phosphate/phosphonate transport system substrate-binding protein
MDIQMSPQKLTLITYLSPSIPAGLYELIADHIREDCGLDTAVTFEARISGPLPGDDNPFADARADVGFLCAPSFRYLQPNVDLLPVPVPNDPRSASRPVYFSDVIVPASSAAKSVSDLRGGRWAFNDRNSKSGWFSLLDRIAPEAAESYFSSLIAAGSHVQAIKLVASGDADAAAIDSNVLRLQLAEHPEFASRIRLLQSWGSFAIQPSVIRSSIDPALKRRIASALLTLHNVRGQELSSFGFERFVESDRSVYL